MHFMRPVDFDVLADARIALMVGMFSSAGAML